MPAAAISLPSPETAKRDDRRRRGLDLTQKFSGGREDVDLAVGAGGDDLAVGRDRDRVERGQQRRDHRRAAGERPDAQGRVIAGGHHRAAVGRERDAVDVLGMAFEHARRAARQRPQPGAVVPGRRSQRRAIRRHRQRHHRRRMAFEHHARRRLAGLPDGDARILAAGGDAAVAEEDGRIHRAVVKPQHLLRAVALQRPADRRRVEAARDRRPAIGCDRERAHRPAVPAQLRGGVRRERNRENQPK